MSHPMGETPLCISIILVNVAVLLEPQWERKYWSYLSSKPLGGLEAEIQMAWACEAH